MKIKDSIECAQRLRNGTADFGIFSAESTLLLATLKWEGLTVIKELRHRDRLQRKHNKPKPIAHIFYETFG